MRISHAVFLLAISLLGLAVLAQAKDPASTSAPADDVEYWLRQASTANNAPASKASEPASRPAGELARPAREDALPGVIELSDGKVLPGYLTTTAEKNWEVFVESEKRWRNIPFLAVLSISAVVDEEKMEQEWRWKEMGVPERVFTGREYPTRRLLWKLHLIDDTYVTGTIKGQPLWLELGSAKIGPMILHERSKGEPGQTLAGLVYVKRVIVSKRMMEQVLAETPK